MDLQYSSEQLQLRDSVERYIREREGKFCRRPDLAKRTGIFLPPLVGWQFLFLKSMAA